MFSCTNYVKSSHRAGEPETKATTNQKILGALSRIWLKTIPCNTHTQLRKPTLTLHRGARGAHRTTNVLSDGGLMTVR